MTSAFLSLSNELKNNSIKICNDKLQAVVQKYIFLDILTQHDIDQNQQIKQNIEESKMLIINQYQISKAKFIIICFNNTLININQLLLNLLQPIFQSYKKFNVCFLSKVKDIFTSSIQFNYQELDIKQKYSKEIENFVYKFNLITSNKVFQIMWEAIEECLSLNLIHKSYLKTNQNRFERFLINDYSPTNKIIDENEFISLYIIDIGFTFSAELIYHIESEELLIIKKTNTNDKQSTELIQREKDNYLKLNHPYLPKFYGITKSNNYLVIEYINGRSLLNVNLNENEKITIIFEIMLIIEYLHHHNFIYRDLKPNNVIIDENKTAVLIDFDRMLSSENISNDQQFTSDFGSYFIAPEVNTGNFSNKCDIYSLGKLIHFIMNKKDELSKYTEIQRIYEQCVKEDANERPTISELILDYFIIFCSEIHHENVFKYQEEYFSTIYDEYVIQTFKNLPIKKYDLDIINRLGVIYFDGHNIPKNYIKAIYYFAYAAQSNYCKSLLNLGSLYIDVYHDINEAIHYYTLAADQNDAEAQFSLGNIYYDKENIQYDINQAIHYYTLAADQNNVRAQYQLGYIYENGKNVPCDINKAIHYYTLAADQNDVYAQFLLGDIYNNKENIQYDINKAIHYYTLASDQNDIKAQYYLGYIYESGEKVPRDINKAIHYYTLAADQNDAFAQFLLGNVYYNKANIQYDINKAIHYYTLAADQNDVRAQHQLGCIYESGENVPRDINKAIHYHTLAANQNYAYAQFSLGNIYYNKENIQYDINKAIHYYTLAADQNHAESQINLCAIYYTGEGVQPDNDKALNYYLLASDQVINDINNIKIILDDKTANPSDINKTIQYFKFAADQNNVRAQYQLGYIYENGKNVPCDINKAIHYYTFAADQNNVEAQYQLGYIYGNGKNIPRDINKAIHYYKLAANQNYIVAQFTLAILYENGHHIPRDINKAIYYYTLAANQNYIEAQFNLALIYNNGKYISRNVNKAIYYYTLAAENNHSGAQINLGQIYYIGDNVPRDIDKGLHYIKLSANQNNPIAQFVLGIYYQYSEFIPHDIDESIHYLTLSASQNYRRAQYFLGFYYLNGFVFPKNIEKGKYWILQAAKNGDVESNFITGYLYHVGEHNEPDIQQAIHFYKEASSFNNQYAKNNLGIIYKNGYEDSVPKNVMLSIEYFKEAINQKNDITSMYNLANVYLYEEPIEKSIDKSIELLVKLSNQNFDGSNDLLCLALIKKFKSKNIEYETINNELNLHKNESDTLPTSIYQMIKYQNLEIDFIYNEIYEVYRNIYYLYDYNRTCIKFPNQNVQRNIERRNAEQRNIQRINIGNSFYEGFGYE